MDNVTSTTMEQPALEFVNLKLSAQSGTDSYDLVTGVSLTVRKGRCTALIGESGSGKSITSIAALGLEHLQGISVTGGGARVGNTNVTLASSKMLEDLRGDEIGLVLQDPNSSLNPTFTVFSQMRAAMGRKGAVGSELKSEAVRRLQEVGLRNAETLLRKYPHELSGGMKQRVMISLALARDPSVLVADEPTTALDVSVQSEILALFRRLVDDRQMGLLLVTHDMGVAAQVSDDTYIMYAGEVVETGPTDNVLRNPRHPYTAALLKSLPQFYSKGEPIEALKGRVPLNGEFPEGCRFHPRCPVASMFRCQDETQNLVSLPDRKHEVRCWRSSEGEFKYGLF